MNKFESKEDYLERILILTQNNKIVRAIDIANSMNYSKPSVSIALKKLKNEDCITVDEHTGAITLTKKGYDIAISIYHRHQILTNALTLIGVDVEIAKEEACKIEHDLSDDTILKIKEFIDKNKKNT